MNKKTLEQILPQVEKPARYLGGEHNSVVKDHASVKVKAVLAFPDVYEIGMSHLGLRILYSLLNKRDDMLLERCFTPWTDMEKALRESGLPLCSLETRTPLSKFDVVGFSLQYELSFTNVLMMLDLADIPFRTEDRDENCPLVVGGGPVVFSPEPVADFFDAFLIGDGEEAFPRLLERFGELREKYRGSGTPRESRKAILRELSGLPGIYVPSLYRVATDESSGLQYVAGPLIDETKVAGGVEKISPEPPFPIRRATLDRLDDFPFPTDSVVPHSDIVHDRISIEIARGCTEGCRFCQAGTIYRPVRERGTESIMNSALDALEKTGYDEVSITSLSPADYSCLPDLVEKMMDRMVESKVGLSISSLRPYGLTEQLATQISRVKKSGFTIAPEAGNQRMRDVLNKGISEEHILQAANNAFGAGWDLIKMYFMIGLPTETTEDLQSMLDLCEKIYGIGRHKLSKKNGGPGGAPRLHFSASSHVPKPHAAFQWARMGTVDELYSKQRYLAARLRNPRIKFKKHHVETSILEGVMSRGDRRLGPVIETAYRNGCRFDGWTEQFRWQGWCDAFKAHDLDMDLYLREIPLESTLPWDHIDTTVFKSFLIREWKRALAAKVSPACEKPFKKFNRPFKLDDKLVCYDCGCACDLPHITEERVANHQKLLAITSNRKPLAAAAVDAPTIRYRAVFRKAGRSRFISHLDMNRAFARGFRRAGLRLKYSQGFNPKPQLTFTPALALGAEGREERLDFQLGSPMPGDEIRRKLNQTLPDGIEVTSISLRAESSPALTSDLQAALYRVSLPEELKPATMRPGLKGSGSVESMPFNEESGLRSEQPESRRGKPEPKSPKPVELQGQVRDPHWHREKVSEFNDADERFIEKFRKGRGVQVDLKQFVGEVSFEGAVETGGVELSFPVEFHNGATVRPEEVLLGIYGFVPGGCSLIREKLVYRTPAATPTRPSLPPHATPAAPAAN